MSQAALPPPTPFDFEPRTRIIFGRGVLGRLGEVACGLSATRALLVTDKGITAAGHAARAVAELERGGVPVALYDAVRENPTTADVARCLEVARAAGVDLIVGLGGGSSMDTAKGVNFILTNGGEIRDYWGVGKARRPMLPLVAIPTTAGTGSECQSAALIADEHTHQKMACLDPKAAAKVALLDPELTVSQPVRVTAVTGVDAIAHALETAVTSKRNPVSGMYAKEAFQRLVRALPVVLRDPANIDARGDMQIGSAFAGLAIENSMLGAAHSAANPLTARFNIVHGAAVGVMLPHVVRFNAAQPAAREAYAELANAAGLASLDAGSQAATLQLVSRLEAVLNLAGIPRGLLEMGVPPDAVSALADEASRQWTAAFNPVAVGADDFRRLFLAAFVPRADSGSS
jgi:alcohol dehydrogenase